MASLIYWQLLDAVEALAVVVATTATAAAAAAIRNTSYIVQFPNVL